MTEQITDQISVVCQMATRAHRGQSDKVGHPYSIIPGVWLNASSPMCILTTWSLRRRWPGGIRPRLYEAFEYATLVEAEIAYTHNHGVALALTSGNASLS